MSTTAGERTLFLFEKPSAMRQLQRLFRSPDTVCVAAEGHLLGAEEPGDVRPEWKPRRFGALPIVLDVLPVRAGKNRSGATAGSAAPSSTSTPSAGPSGRPFRPGAAPGRRAPRWRATRSGSPSAWA